MAQNLVINGVTYNGIESISMLNTDEEEIEYLPSDIYATKAELGGYLLKDQGAINANKTLIVGVDGKVTLADRPTSGSGTGDVSDIALRLDTLETNIAADITAIMRRLVSLEGSTSGSTAQDISITEFEINPHIVEIGSTVTSAELSWRFNKMPTAVTLDGVEQSVTSTGKTLTDQSITSYKTWTLSATGENGNTVQKSAGVYFLNGVYYGASSSTTVNNELILGLTKSLRSSILTSFSVANGDEKKYVYYCFPARFGTCYFKVGTFWGGINLVETLSFTNASGYTEDYYVYRSDYAVSGNINATVAKEMT